MYRSSSKRAKMCKEGSVNRYITASERGGGSVEDMTQPVRVLADRYNTASEGGSIDRHNTASEGFS